MRKFPRCGVKRGGSAEWGDGRSAFAPGMWRWSSVSAGQEAVHGRNDEEAGHRRMGTCWMKGGPLKNSAEGVRLWAVLLFFRPRTRTQAEGGGA
jgi:hypothetical protein